MQQVLGSGVMDAPPSTEPPRRAEPVDTGPLPPRATQQPHMDLPASRPSESRPVQSQRHAAPAPEEPPPPDIEAQAASVDTDDDEDVPF